jgi:GntR family transcriptional regulator
MTRSRNADVADLGDPPCFQQGRPKGEQLYEHLESLVSALPPGSLLPSEHTMAEHFGVARMTLRQQLDGLARSGQVTRLPGRGTFVTEPRFIQTDSMSSFSRDMRARGLKPGSISTYVAVDVADAVTAAKLDIAPGDSIVHVSRVRTANDIPMAYERTNLPAERFPGLEHADLAHGSLFQIIEETYRVRAETAEQRISVLNLGERESKLLEVPVGSPAFDIERITRDNMGKAVEFGRSIYRGDRYEVLMHIGIAGHRAT